MVLRDQLLKQFFGSAHESPLNRMEFDWVELNGTFVISLNQKCPGARPPSRPPAYVFRVSNPFPLLVYLLFRLFRRGVGAIAVPRATNNTIIANAPMHSAGWSITKAIPTSTRTAEATRTKSRAIPLRYSIVFPRPICLTSHAGAELNGTFFFAKSGLSRLVCPV